MAYDIEKILQSIDGKKMPPVELWNPSVIGEIDIQIDDTMRWMHEGVYFQRQALVQLLASILRKEGENYYLVTPAEKMKIQVSDVPFEIIHMKLDENQAAITLISNTEDIIHLQQANEWQLRNYRGITIPYIHVRKGMWARVSRAVYYQMSEYATLNHDGKIGLWVADQFYPLE